MGAFLLVPAVKFILAVILIATFSLSQSAQADDYNADLRTTGDRCYYNVPTHFTTHCDYPGTQANMLENCETPYVTHQSHPQSWVCDVKQTASYKYFDQYNCEAGDYIYQSGGTWMCSTEPLEEPECSVPAGTVSKITSSSPLGSSTCYQNCLTQTRPSGGAYLMILASGQRTYWYDGTSTGEYCDAPSGAQSAPPFENYTDEDGCYMGLDGRYCPSGGGSCPNSATAPDGGVYCRTPPDAEPCNEGGGPGGESYCGPDDPNYEEPSDSDANSDSDDDGIPNGVDPHPEDPDADGDGTPDGEQDGDGNGIPDGEPGGIEDNDDGDGTEPGDGSHDGGTCTQEERAEPECHDMDATQCALAIELFHVRCDDKLRDEELYGTPEQREQIEQDTDNLLNDENPENQLPEDTIDFADAVSDLDDSSWLNGSCPSPISVPVMGTTLDWTFQPACDLFELLRPVIIALGYLAASLIILRGMQF